MTTTLTETRPPHGTQEWAARNVNIQDGCEHDCRYCYAKTMAIRFKRERVSIFHICNMFSEPGAAS